MALSEQEIEEMIQRIEEGELNQVSAADAYKVHRNTVRNVLIRRGILPGQKEKGPGLAHQAPS